MTAEKDRPDMQVDERVQKLQQEQPERYKSYSAALEAVLIADPDLARRYEESQGVVGIGRSGKEHPQVAEARQLLNTLSDRVSEKMRASASAGAEVDQRVKTYMQEHPEVKSYGDAMESVLALDPALRKRYEKGE